MSQAEQFSLRWNNHQKTLISSFEALLETENFTDCTLFAGDVKDGEVVKAHRVVLSACSPVFETMLKTCEKGKPIIYLKDVTYIELKAVVEYMYKGEVNIHQDNLDSFLATAASLQVKGLTDRGGGGNGGSEPPAKKGRVEEVSGNDAPESPLVGNAPLRDGTSSPRPRRRRARRPSSDDQSADNSCDVPQPTVQQTPPAPLPPPSLPVSTLTPESSRFNRRQQPTPQPEPKIELIQPKMEVVDRVEDLTFDDDDDDYSAMETKPGPSYGLPQQHHQDSMHERVEDLTFDDDDDDDMDSKQRQFSGLGQGTSQDFSQWQMQGDTSSGIPDMNNSQQSTQDPKGRET